MEKQVVGKEKSFPDEKELANVFGVLWFVNVTAVFQLKEPPKISLTLPIPIPDEERKST